MSPTYSPSTHAHAQGEVNSAARPRGKSRVRRYTYDIDSEQAAVHAPLGDDGSFESAALTRKAFLAMIDALQVQTANAVRYGQGIITRVGAKALSVIFGPNHGYDYWSGTNDLAGSEIARRGGFSVRQWQRLKPELAELGVLSFVHRSIKTGLETAPGVDQDLQISDLYWFSPAALKPWIRELYDQILAGLKRESAAIEHREGKPRPRRPLVKRDKPKCRIPERLNPIGWARCLAAAAKASASPSVAYAAREAEAVAFAARLARAALPG